MTKRKAYTRVHNKSVERQSDGSLVDLTPDPLG